MISKWKSFLFGQEKENGAQSEHANTNNNNTQTTQQKEDSSNGNMNEDCMAKVNLHLIYNKKEEYTPQGNATDNSCEHENVLTTFGLLLNESQIDYNTLKEKSWKGIPAALRPVVWKIILDYQSPNRQQANEQLKKLREEYFHYVIQYGQTQEDIDLQASSKEGEQNKSQIIFSKQEANMIKVVETDVPRTQTMYEIFKARKVQQMLRRVLVIWGLRHPACGYVQGMNEVASPFVIVFLSEFCQLNGEDSYKIPKDYEQISEEQWQSIEADTYWCLQKVLDRIQDNYTAGQPGIKRGLDKINQIIKKTDPLLSQHLLNEKVEYVQFSFRWILCLLIREFQLHQVIRIFDTYLADDQGVSVLHIYVCAALILKYSKTIKKKWFNEIITFFQNLPTENWSNQDIEMLLGEAYVYCSLYEHSQGHIKQASNHHSISWK